MQKNNDTKLILVMLLMNLTSIACAVGAILLALNGIKGWGWFLACSILSTSTYKSTKGSEDGEQVSVG